MANGLDAMSWNQNNNCVAQQPAFIMNVFMAVGVTCVVALHAPRSAPPPRQVSNICSIVPLSSSIADSASVWS